MIDWRRSQKITWIDDTAALNTASAPERAEDRIEARDLISRIEGALQRLPPTQREVVLLSRYAGLDTEEIAQVTGQTPGAVRVTLHRALQRLRALLSE